MPRVISITKKTKKQSAFIESRVYPICKKSFTTYKSSLKVCCSLSCARKKQCRDPKHCKQVSERMKKRFQDSKARKQQSEQMKKRWQDPGYKRTGTGVITEPQRILAQELGNVWETEVVIGLGKKIPGYKACYLVDIGNQELKLAIEIDGPVHKWEKQQILDQKKEDKLKELGWKVIRFWNHEILEDLPEVMRRIKFIFKKY